MIGTDAFDWIRSTPLDDEIDAGGGDDSIDVRLAGTDFVDGGAGVDGVSVIASGDYQISATADGAIKIETSEGSVSVTNVEHFHRH